MSTLNLEKLTLKSGGHVVRSDDRPVEGGGVMSTAARKARKRAGEKFVRTPKVGTPLLDRAEFAGQVYGPVKGRARWHWRSKKKVARAAAARGIEVQ